MKKSKILTAFLLSGSLVMSPIALNVLNNNHVFAAEVSKTPFIYEKDGLKVTINKVSIDEEEGYKIVNIYYKQENITKDSKIPEINFALFLTDGSKEKQYGFFNDLFPGEKKERVFSVKLLKSQEPSSLEFNSDFFETTLNKDKTHFYFVSATDKNDQPKKEDTKNNDVTNKKEDTKNNDVTDKKEDTKNTDSPSTSQLESPKTNTIAPNESVLVPKPTLNGSPKTNNITAPKKEISTKIDVMNKVNKISSANMEPKEHKTHKSLPKTSAVK